jgi:hypothetical protein
MLRFMSSILQALPVIFVVHHRHFFSGALCARRPFDQEKVVIPEVKALWKPSTVSICPCTNSTSPTLATSHRGPGTVV